MANKQSAANAFVRTVLQLIGEDRDLQGLGLAPGELRDKKIRATLMKEFDSKCAYCGVSVATASQIDHLDSMNKSVGGLHMLGNLVLACPSCNSAKSDKPVEEFLKSQPGIANKLRLRQQELGAQVDLDETQKFASEAYAAVVKLLEEQIQEAKKRFSKSLPAIKKLEGARFKANFDFTETALSFPVGSRVKAKKDGLEGEVYDYSLEGDKGKRQPYVRFITDAGEKYTRSPNQLVRL